MARYYGYGYTRKNTRGAEKFISGLFKAGMSMASALEREAKRQQREQARQAASYNRLVAQVARERVRQDRQKEMTLRQAERERMKAERERERAARLQAKLDEQKRFEEEVTSIEEDNYLWTHIHSLIDHIVTLDDINDVIERCIYEQQNNVPDGYFKTEYPKENHAKELAQKEADAKYNVDKAKEELDASTRKASFLLFDESEPTRESVIKELRAEAKEKIHTFWPWTSYKKRKEYVSELLSSRFERDHCKWLSKKNEYETNKIIYADEIADKRKAYESIIKEKVSFLENRTKELYDEEVETWKTEKHVFYESLRQSLQNTIDGNKDYVISTISNLFPDEELPIEYFVDYDYDEEKGKVVIDLDLPEIEDIPNRKIVLTPTGKKSIRMKGQSDLRSDYANCAFGLAMYVAYSIFNISLKVKSVEISGFTQRKEENSALATDQYIFVVDFIRDLFSIIDFNRLSSIEIMDFFHRNFNMTKSYDLKQIDLEKAYKKMESFIPANYDDYISRITIDDKSQFEPILVEDRAEPTSSLSTSLYVNDAPIETFEKSFSYVSELYAFVDALSKDPYVNKHTENLDGIVIRLTGGNFNGDGDVRTYRGKFFFCMMIDLYRSLEKMNVNMNAITPSGYSLALMIDNIYIHKGVSFTDLSIIEHSFVSYCEMVRDASSKIPVFDHFFLVAETLFDYEKDLSWYQKYVSLMSRHIEIVRDAIHNDSKRRKYVDEFIKMLKTKLPSIDIGL